MDAASILTLYAISSPVHVLVNTHMHAVVRASALHAFPWSTTAFPFAMMRSLCVPDPAADRHALGLRTVQPRLVPGLRWLAMAYFRCGVADGIWAALRDRGHRLPRGVAAPAACHLWFTMAMPANAQRLGLLRSKHYWSDAVLRAAVLLMVKLEHGYDGPRRRQWCSCAAPPYAQPAELGAPTASHYWQYVAARAPYVQSALGLRGPHRPGAHGV